MNMLWHSSRHQPDARHHGAMVKALGFGEMGLGANSASATSELCDLGQVTEPPSASVFLCMKWKREMFLDLTG